MKALFLVAVAVASTPLTEQSLLGTWIGRAAHGGEDSPVAVEFATAKSGDLYVKWSLPDIHAWSFPVAKVTVEGQTVRMGPAHLTHDATNQTLVGVVPEELAPVHRIPVTFRRGELSRPDRPPLTARVAQPRWRYDAGAPLWAGVAFADGVVYAGADDGRLHALDGRSGRALWTFRAGGAIRGLPTVEGKDVLIGADDGMVYRVNAATGREVWRTPVAAKPIQRLPYGQGPRSDYGGSGVATAGDRLYLGTYDGRVVALDAARGTKLWDFTARDSVLATPLVDSGRVYAGSFDGNVYALRASDGSLLWTHATGAPVVSTPALDGGRIVVGSRSYDLAALDASTGRPVWTRYFWFSWVESSPRVRDGVVYVGSSDAARVSAIDGATGRPRWVADVWGSAWGQPAVTASRVFVGTLGTRNYIADHRAGVLALDRATGRVEWRHPVEPPTAKPSGERELTVHGFPGAPAVGGSLAYFGGLDGTVYAFEQ